MHKSFFFILLLVISFFVYLWQQNTSIRFAYKISALQTEYNNIISENDNLRLKINSMLALEKMYKIAKERNFVVADGQNTVYIE
jgi:cell division protein FtsL